MACARASTSAARAGSCGTVLQPGRIVEKAQGRQAGEVDIAAAVIVAHGNSAIVAGEVQRALEGAGDHVAEVMLVVDRITP